MYRDIIRSMVFICLICHKQFSTYKRKRKLCSRRCTGIYQSRPIIKACAFCGLRIKRSLGNYGKHKHHFCDRKCQHEWEKVNKIKFPQLRNKDWCIEQYKTLSLIKIAKKLQCGETTVYKYFKIHGIKLDRSRWISGSKHYFWKNGITKLTRAIRTSQKYLIWRRSVFANNPRFCAICGETKNLEADHIKKFKFILIDNKIKSLQDALNCEELWDVRNGRILCSFCNKKDCCINRKTSI